MKRISVQYIILKKSKITVHTDGFVQLDKMLKVKDDNWAGNDKG